MEIELRAIEGKDYLSLLPLWNNELGSRYVSADNIAPHYDRVKGDERYKTFVALLDNEIVGFVSSVQSFGVGIEGSFMQIIGIAVKTEKQNKGIGTKLLQHMENYAKAIGVFHISLNTGINRTAAHAFYERKGYRTGENLNFGKKL